MKRTKTLGLLLDALCVTEVVGGETVAIRALPVQDLCFDSRKAGRDTVFFCLVGKITDGHLYAERAFAAGCRIFVVERRLTIDPSVVQILVPSTRAALADGAAAFFGHPERQLRLIGLTGTKGKTTTAILLRHVLCAGGIPTGYIGTNGVDYGEAHYATVNSTPESLELYRHLRGMVDAGIKACVLEVSSQGLWMERIRGLCFDTTAFLNLARDHIGDAEHPTMAHYAACKRRLFTDYPADAIVYNRKDAATPAMLAGIDQSPHPPRMLPFAWDEPSFTEGVSAPGYQAQAVKAVRAGDRIGVSFTVRQDGVALGRCFLPLPGTFNVENALCVLAIACERFGLTPAEAMGALATAQVPGRFETVIHPALPEVTFVIDYAHNGLSLASILDALREQSPTRVIALFGSVGERTKERRRDMAEAAAYRADLCILTADNPGSEPVMDILHEMNRAFPPDACPRLLEPDRICAIERAVELACPGDIILLAGKGHEAYQLLGRERVPFCERALLLAAIEAHTAAIPV